MSIIGILALQGGFDAHRRSIERLGRKSILVRSRDDLQHTEALIIPGGESTVMIQLLQRLDLLNPLKERIQSGMPVFGTCAGMILLSSGIYEKEQETLNIMDFLVLRNAYGRQSESFEAVLHWKDSTKSVMDSSIPGVFIRAPRVTELGKKVTVLMRFEKHPVLLQQGSCLAASFHPELTASVAVHSYFLNEIVHR
ncbi:MAG: pyridoxal 5'-phosphate synthase glutaminase subunit PdxT [Spirochaetales bacterium]|nr:pyridoxal 5'-phosphate synthase glutaminase subunit PdxT [Spirochaetales bacterium]